jgi:parallel beta-helix repeat protein
MLALRRYPRSAPGGPRTGRPLARGLAVLLGSGACAALPWATVTGSPAAASAAPAAAAPAAAGASATPAARSVTVRTLADSGPGSLRAAIRAGDAAPPGTATVIRFAVTGTITLRAALPAVTRQVIIDGTTAPGYRAGGAPLVAVNASGHQGLRFAAGSNQAKLLGLAVDRARGAGVTLEKAWSVTINSDYIGLNLGGRAAGNGGPGIYVAAASGGNFIGRNPSARPGVVGNVVSGNRRNGIVLSGSATNAVVANRIGTNPAGTAAIGNGGSGLVLARGARSNEIGGTAFTDPATGQANNPTGDKGTVPPVFVVPPLGNLISGNARNGVLIESGSTNNHLNGNFVGTTPNGDGALGNRGNGVWITGANSNSLTGCKFVNNPFVYYNVVSGNGANGLRITNSHGTVVQGNFFGSAANNATVVRNRLDGIRIDGTSADTQVGGVIPLGNVSAGNGRNGIEVAGRARNFTTFNTFGGLHAFGGAAPNGRDGILITSSGRGNLVRTNVMSGNRRNGIELGGNATGVTVDPDIAGLNTDGNATLPNGGDGLRIDGNAHGNVIGGTLRSVIPQDTFSGNSGYGIVITGRAHGNRVTTAFVGTAILGVNALANQRGGILVAGSAAGNSIGLARSPLPANLISGNRGIGVTLARGTRGNLVLRNFIGLNRFGRPLPNAGGAVSNAGLGNVVRGNRT